MLPPATFKLDAVKDVFAEFGIHVLEEFSDGQIRWGDEPLSMPYKALSHISDCLYPSRIDIFTVRAIANKLEKAGDLPKMEAKLQRALVDEEYEFREPGDDESPEDRTRPN